MKTPEQEDDPIGLIADTISKMTYYEAMSLGAELHSFFHQEWDKGPMETHEDWARFIMRWQEEYNQLGPIDNHRKGI